MNKNEICYCETYFKENTIEWLDGKIRDLTINLNRHSKCMITGIEWDVKMGETEPTFGAKLKYVKADKDVNEHFFEETNYVDCKETTYFRFARGLTYEEMRADLEREIKNHKEEGKELKDVVFKTFDCYEGLSKHLALLTFVKQPDKGFLGYRSAVAFQKISDVPKAE